MVIWFDDVPLDYANERVMDSLIAHLGIEVIEAGDDYLKARMPSTSAPSNRPAAPR